MKKLLIALLMLVAVSIQAQKVFFIDALIEVESGGNWDAVGDNGKALGGLQIRKEVIEDVNKFYNKNYEHSDAFSREKAIEICGLYLRYWGEQYEKKYDHKPSIEDYARIWNGGPTGYMKKSTYKYWKKVVSLMSYPKAKEFLKKVNQYKNLYSKK